MALNPNPSELDFQQIIQRAFNGTDDRLRVDAELSASIIAPPGLEVSIQAADDNIAIRNSNNSNELLINNDGSINVNANISADPDVNLFQVGGTATSVNNGTADNGTQRVVIASNNTAFSVNSVVALNTSSTASVSQVASSGSNVTLLASNSSRKNAVFYNNSEQSCYVKFGTTASLVSFTIKMEPGSILILDTTPIYTGRIDGIWDSADGAMAVTELT